MLVFLHEMLVKSGRQGTDSFVLVTEVIWLAAPNSLIQNSSLVLRNEASKVDFQNCGKPSQGFALSGHPQNDLADGIFSGVCFGFRF